MLTAITPEARGASRVGWLSLVLVLLIAPGALRAEDETDPGQIFTVPAPITPDTAARLDQAVTDAFKRAEPRRNQREFKAVFDFNPDGRANESRQFGPCYELADFLRKLQGRGVHTVAYVHGQIARHSVLPVLACSPEIVFSKSGELGDVVRDPGETLDAVKRLAYEEVARDRVPVALVRKMFDRDLVVVRTPAGGGDRYHDAREVKAGEPVLLSGTVARYTFSQASAFGICRAEPRETIADVAAAYNLGHVEANALSSRTPVAWLIGVSGPLNAGLNERLKRRVTRAFKANANLLIFQLRCVGGDSESAADLAAYVEYLNKDRPNNPVRTVAWVTDEAGDSAAYPALACDRIVMQSKAKLGGFDHFLQVNPDRAEIVRKSLEELAKRHSYPPVVARAFADSGLRVYRVVPTRGGSAQFIDKTELDEDLARLDRRWKDERPITTDDGQCLTLDAEKARAFGIADAVEDDVTGVYQIEGVEPAQVYDATSDRDWLEDLADFLRYPATRVVLVMIGITCLILELKMPGTTLPGVIAAVCFVLFFWSHSQLNGQITWLALLLFLLGLMLIGLEMFVLPGVGVAGISGTVLVLGSLGLVAYGKWPHSNEDWAEFGRTIGPFGISVLGAMAAAFVLARFLPSIPFANRLMLRPVGEASEFGEDTLATGAGGPDLSSLLGAVGVAATPLRPAGKVQFGDEFVDVVAEGGYVPPGARVQVIEIEGIRVVVKEV